MGRRRADSGSRLRNAHRPRSEGREFVRGSAARRPAAAGPAGGGRPDDVQPAAALVHRGAPGDQVIVGTRFGCAVALVMTAAWGPVGPRPQPAGAGGGSAGDPVLAEAKVQRLRPLQYMDK